jgi:hypothetical protein
MPFGLKDDPRIFSHIMRYAATAIREFWKIRTMVYLDDIILLHQDKNHLLQAGKEITLFLQWLGWTVNHEKSHLVPSRTWKYSGWEWNSVNRLVCLPKKRRLKALATLRMAKKKIHKRKKITTRSLAKIIGQLSACRLQFPLASLYLVKLNTLKTLSVNHVGWNRKTFLNNSIDGELGKWTSWIKENRYRYQFQQPHR